MPALISDALCPCWLVFLSLHRAGSGARSLLGSCLGNPTDRAQVKQACTATGGDAKSSALLSGFLRINQTLLEHPHPLQPLQRSSCITQPLTAPGSSGSDSIPLFTSCALCKPLSFPSLPPPSRTAAILPGGSHSACIKGIHEHTHQTSEHQANPQTSRLSRSERAAIIPLQGDPTKPCPVPGFPLR